MPICFIFDKKVLGFSRTCSHMISPELSVANTYMGKEFFHITSLGFKYHKGFTALSSFYIIFYKG
ncbi:MAG: hypothetical protein AAF696_05665, partial [Bacteroidota bacterium]